jgi:large subunit ribosomal protein L16
MLFPKKVAHRKWQSNRKSDAKLLRPATRGITVAFGDWGLQATTPSRVRSNQIEAARRVISRTLGKTGKIWIRIFPDQPVTKKAAEVPMGKGKGDPDHFVFEVAPGRILFEVQGVSDELAQKALRKAVAKLPLKAKVVSKAQASVTGDNA